MAVGQLLLKHKPVFVSIMKGCENNVLWHL